MRLDTSENNNKLLYSNVSGESINFEIGDPSVIIDIIRKKIYSYPLRSMVQEYLSNAADACREAGKTTGNIEVTLPTKLDPQFVIRDYGVGMDDNRVRDVFVRYGVSTKRESNSQLGCFGIGAKSGWAYTDSFIVESYYNGIHTKYIADIGENQEGRLIVLKTSETTAPNGVAIRISVRPNDIEDFRCAYIWTTFLWDERPKTNKEVIYPEIKQIFDDVVIADPRTPFGYDVYVNAGGIPFKVQDVPNPLRTLQRTLNSMLCIKADPRKLKIAANRENYSNQKYVTELLTATYDKLVKHVQNCFDNTKPENYRRLIDENLRYLSKLYSFKYKPYELSRYLESLGVQLKISYFLHLTSYNLGSRFYSKYSLDLNPTNGSPIYISNDKGVIPNRIDKYFKTPHYTKKTKKALSNITKLIRNNTLSSIIILFQDTETDDNYQEICSVLNIQKSIEDEFGHLNLKKEPKTEKIKREITIRTWSSGRCKSYEQTLSDVLENQDTLLFFSKNCAATRDISDLEIFRAYLVHAKLDKKIRLFTTTDAMWKRIQKLKHPRIHTIENVLDFITEDVMQTFMDLHVTSMMRQIELRRIVDIFPELNYLEVRIVRIHILIWIFSNMEVKSKFLDIFKKYPLLSHIDWENMSDTVLDHINYYIKSIDEGEL